VFDDGIEHDAVENGITKRQVLAVADDIHVVVRRDVEVDQAGVRELLVHAGAEVEHVLARTRPPRRGARATRAQSAARHSAT
jgi:hypothetical protein